MKKIIIGIVIGLSTVTVAIGGYKIYQVFTTKPVDKNQNTETKEPEVAKEVIIENFNKLLPHLEYITRYEKKIEDFNNISNQDKLLLVANYIASKNEVNWSTYFSDTKSSSLLKTEGFEKLFKNKIDYTNESFSCCEESDYMPAHCHVLYNENSDTYSSNQEYGHGGNNNFLYDSKLIDFKKVKNQYELTYIQYFEAHTDFISEGKLYTKYSCDNEPIIDVGEENIEEDHEVYEQKLKNAIDAKNKELDTLDNYDAYPKYKYIIELDENNNPLLVGYEFIEAK